MASRNVTERARRALTTTATPTDDDDAFGIGSAYSLRKRVAWAVVAVVAAVIIAGFWNYKFVDGIGRDMVAHGAIGDTTALSGSYAERGAGFGFVFAAVAGLAATFTACNCVVFAMIPGLACSTDKSATRKAALKALGVFTVTSLAVGAAYGVFVGFLGPEGASAINARAVRLAQANAVFSIIGAIMLAWGAIELGFLDRWVQRLNPVTRQFFAMPTTKAGLMGLLVGFFAIGRPFPVFREFLTYAATAESPTYGAAVMAVQGVGQIAVMVLLFLALVYFGGSRLTKWVQEKPHAPTLVSGVALIAGGVYFVYYWGLAFAFNIGRWGFKLGWWT